MKRKHPSSSPQANPFETRGNKRLHFDVLGRRVTGAKRDVSKARNEAHERRSKELLPEMRNAFKRNTFKDRRFGEGDPSLDEETKSLVRFQKERMRQLGVSKRSKKFLVEEDEGEEATLTHGGMALGDMAMDGFEGGGDNDDDGDGVLDAGVHFGGGGGEGEEDRSEWRGKVAPPAWAAAGGGGAGGTGTSLDPNHKRSYQEIMDEVMAKSKAARAARAEDSQEQRTLLESLDSKLGLVESLLRGGGGGGGKKQQERVQRGEEDFLASMTLATGGAVGGGGKATTTTSTTRARKPLDEFDSLVGKLAKESRSASATDRTKSAEELAEAEAERLKELEILRMERMRGGGWGWGGQGGRG